jgi:putative DNA primase/helicase
MAQREIPSPPFHLYEDKKRDLQYEELKRKEEKLRQEKLRQERKQKENKDIQIDEMEEYENERRIREEDQQKELYKTISSNISSNLTDKKIKKKEKVITIKHADWYRYNNDGEIIKFMSGRFVDMVTTDVKSIVVNNDFYIHKDGYYKSVKDNYIQGLIQDNIDSSIRTWSQITDVFNQWRTNIHVYKEEYEINTNPFLLNLKNGIYDLKNNQFQDNHETEVIMTRRIEANYNPNLTEKDGENFHMFLDQIQPDKGVQAVIQEIMGYCLTELVEAQKFFVFDGVSRSGKSTIISLIESLIAPENISHVPLQDLHGFNLYTLYNKTLNTMADLPTTAIPPENLIKALVGEDPLHADRKHTEAIQFYNKAKLLFSTNGMPKNHSDRGDAFFQRLLIVPFTIQVPEEKRDRMLKYKLKNELDYIFNWCLQGLVRLIHENKFQFSSSKIIEDKNEQYKNESNSLLQFITEYCELDPKGQIPTEWFNEEYKKFCSVELDGITPMGKHTVRDYLRTNLKIQCGENIRMTTTDGKRVRSYRGIKFK